MGSALRRMCAALAATLILGMWTVAAQQAPGRWITGKFTPLPEPAEEYTSAVANGKLYLIGGNAVALTPGSPSTHPARVMEYDVATDKWTRKKPVPFAGDHMTAAEYRSKIYVFGGQGPSRQGGPNVPLDASWEYDPTADTWKALAPMPVKRVAAAAVETGGKIYVIGGNTEGGLTLSTVDAYDPAANRWEGRRPMPTPRNHPAAGVVNGKIYVIGGRLAAPNIGGFVSSNTDVNEEYDPVTDTWRGMTKMPTSRSGHGWTTLSGRIYIAGGEGRDYHMDAVYRDVEAFDPATNSWDRLPPLPTARHGVNVVAFGNRLHVIGGHLAFAAGGGHALDAATNEAFEFTK